MKLLISCCNESGGLYTFNTKSNKIKAIFNDCDFKGIASDKNYIYTYSNTIKQIIKFDKNFSIVKTVKFVKDAHGLYLYNDILYAVDTFYDSICRFYSNDLTYIDFTNFNSLNNMADACHINDIFIYNDNVYLCMHNGSKIKIDDPKNRKSKSNKGCVKTTSLDKVVRPDEYKFFCNNLHQPHSPFIYDNNFFVCNSRNGSINKYSINGNIGLELTLSKTLDGFTRGIYVDKNNVYVGLSKSNSHNNLDFMKYCGVAILDRNTLDEKDFIELRKSNEVYNIIGI